LLVFGQNFMVKFIKRQANMVYPLYFWNSNYLYFLIID
jgi:hypothetical protein